MEQPPKRPQDLFAAALRYHQAGRLNEAEQLYRDVLQREPAHADAWHFLGVAALQRGQSDVAVELIAKAIGLNGKVPSFHNNLGNALKEQGRLDDAAASYRRTLQLKPDHVEAHYNLGLVLQAKNEPEAAAACFRQALVLKPSHFQALFGLGTVLMTDGKPDEALASYRQALAVKADFAEVHNNIGSVLQLQGKRDEAAAAYRRAVAIKPGLAEAHANLGLVLLAGGRLDDAAASCRRALAHKPDYAEAHKTLGLILMEQGHQSDARKAFEQALAIAPDFAEAKLGLTVAAIPVFADDAAASARAADDFAAALASLEDWSRAHPGKLGKAIGGSQPFYLAYRPTDVRAQLSRYGDLASASATEYWRKDCEGLAAARPRRDRVRLLIVSGQARRHHPVWEVLLRGIIARLDRRRFEVFFFHTEAADGAEAAWAASQVDRFVGGPKSVRAWLDEVRQDRPDVILYPEIGMDPMTATLAALRLAPLQVAGWGHPVTTGLPTIDLFLSGDLLESPDADRHYCEKLVRLPGTGVCMDASADLAKPWNAPPAASGTVRFALCQQPIKFDPGDDALLARIAKAVGPSEFWLLTPPGKLDWATAKLRDRLATAFRAEGLDPDAHLRVTAWLAPDEFAGFLEEMDVYLDCPAFSGYTTAWHAVQRGLPIVTLEGEFLRQRLAAGLLRQIGATDAIASSRERYFDLAVHLAQQRSDTAHWLAQRENLRAAAAKANGNHAAVTALEEALIQALAAR
jgi:predicted O-linked N-acetylglucosamine transferase (SPINDLY family)